MIKLFIERISHTTEFAETGSQSEVNRVRDVPKASSATQKKKKRKPKRRKKGRRRPKGKVSQPSPLRRRMEYDRALKERLMCHNQARHRGNRTRRTARFRSRSARKRRRQDPRGLPSREWAKRIDLDGYEEDAEVSLKMAELIEKKAELQRRSK